MPADIESEYTLMQHLGKTTGSVRFKQHRDQFITEADFREMGESGLNTVRIPIGFWIRPGAYGSLLCYASRSLPYLDSAMTWAGKYGLKILIDIHGAMGSQNGHWNSGAADVGVTAWGYTESVQDTLNLVEHLAYRYRYNGAFLGIGLLNEPGESVDLTVLKKYYTDAYDIVRDQVGSSCILTVAPRCNEQHPTAPGDWQNFMTDNSRFYNVWMDWHKYQIWGYKGVNNKQGLVDIINNDVATDIRCWRGIPLFIGEWTIATIDGLGALFSDSDWRELAAAQMQAFAPTKGRAFWTWKFYGDLADWQNEWSFQNVKLRGLL